MSTVTNAPMPTTAQSFVDSFTRDFFSDSLFVFQDIWLAIWIWELAAFALVQFIAGIIAFAKLRGDVPFAWLAPLVMLVLSIIIPTFAGIVTSMLIAGTYQAVEQGMSHFEALLYGVGQCIVYVIATFSPRFNAL
eukprot:m.23789 g.23789  ORF g.23789 m.23789 type:complete len:135 (+) comp8528_c0_seq4:154-558(+)